MKDALRLLDIHGVAAVLFVANVLLAACYRPCDEWVSTPLDGRIRKAEGIVAIGADGSVFGRRRVQGFPPTEFTELLFSAPEPLLALHTPAFEGLYDLEARYAVVGERGTIAISKGNGVEWDLVPAPTTEDLYGVRFFCGQPDRGLVSGAAGVILSTEAGGAAWELRPSGTSQALRAVTVLRDGVAVAVGDAGTIIRSEDYGATWSPVASGTAKDLASVDFGDCWDHSTVGDELGIAVGADGVVLVSENRGETWKQASLPIQHDLRQAQLNYRSPSAPEPYAALVGDDEIVFWEFGTDAPFDRLTFPTQVYALEDRDSPQYAIGDAQIFSRKRDEWCPGRFD
ncbi:WD40/YVTN/BNR-like repeat-containing protein [Nannocystis bainbridge]|uniref:Photosynthesis system II assembly factor Ycf48/Hcf136-like domain-containing protein n=1 Tax=Nannocystis bainbridge TaxID=2995303 RepID=A0ABT5E0M9_9BACT|nr:YCF48-related protein [Nannocystis bainbridge]MDC0719440.1 hypothetical protein [Nannocystis bainbridge]